MKHYRDKDVTDPHFSRNQILDKLLSTARNSKRHPIPHYRKKYKSVPPWVLFTDTYLGTLVNFTKFLKGSERDALVSLLYGSDTTHEQMELLKGLLHDTAFICYDYRNRAAHGGIMYNFRPKTTIKSANNGVLNIHPGLPQLYFALKKLKYDIPANNLYSEIKNALNNYCKYFHTAEDIQRLQKVTGFKITSQNYVWSNDTTKKFHNTPHCSGMKNPSKVNILKVEELGLKPCKKCCVTEP